MVDTLPETGTSYSRATVAMDNSKDVSQGKKSSIKLLNWGLVLAILAMLCILVWPHIPKFGSHPNPAAESSLRSLIDALKAHYDNQKYSQPDPAAESSLRSLIDVLKAHYADNQKYPQPDKVTSFRPEDGVTALHVVTSRDGQHYFAMAFNTEEDGRLYFSHSNSPLIWWIPFPKQGLVTADHL